ncbi:MAG: glucosylglycerol hydrolase [Leptolyngbyaceae cyanobacterium]
MLFLLLRLHHCSGGQLHSARLKASARDSKATNGGWISTPITTTLDGQVTKFNRSLRRYHHINSRLQHNLTERDVFSILKEDNRTVFLLWATHSS